MLAKKKKPLCAQNVLYTFQASIHHPTVKRRMCLAITVQSPFSCSEKPIKYDLLRSFSRLTH